MTSKSEKSLEHIGMERNIILASLAKRADMHLSAMVDGQKEMNKHFGWVSFGIKASYVMAGLSLIIWILVMITLL